MGLDKVSRRSTYIKALQCTNFHGHAISQSFFIEADVSHWLCFKKLGKIITLCGLHTCKKGFSSVKILLQSPLNNFLKSCEAIKDI